MFLCPSERSERQQLFVSTTSLRKPPTLQKSRRLNNPSILTEYLFGLHLSLTEKAQHSRE